MYAQNKNRTYISDLPELEDLEPPGHYGAQNYPFQQRDHHSDYHTDTPDNYKKFIRTGMGPPRPESGMYSPSPMQPAEFFQSPKPQHKVEEKMLDTPKVNILPSCIDIHEHVINCPICSRYYKTDNSIYIIAIVVLCIICILLLKRVLDL